MGKYNLRLVQYLKERLEFFDNEIHPLNGISDVISKECLIDQMVDSVRRIDYVKTLRDRQSLICPDARNDGFNPIIAAIYHQKNGDIDESIWLVFLLTYFGKSLKSNWELIRNFYGDFGQSSAYWTWNKVNNSRDEFANWIFKNSDKLREIGKFSNHRRYIGFNPHSNTGLETVVNNYLTWIGYYENHDGLLNQVNLKSNKSAISLFRVFYKAIPTGLSLARLGKFDFLTMVSKVGILDMEPDSTYLVGSSGPKSGAILLFYGSNYTVNVDIKLLQEKFDLLGSTLNIPYCMQVLEDSVCNWQKSPTIYKYFRG